MPLTRPQKPRHLVTFFYPGPPESAGGRGRMGGGGSTALNMAMIHGSNWVIGRTSPTPVLVFAPWSCTKNCTLWNLQSSCRAGLEKHQKHIITSTSTPQPFLMNFAAPFSALFPPFRFVFCYLYLLGLPFYCLYSNCFFIMHLGSLCPMIFYNAILWNLQQRQKHEEIFAIFHRNLKKP